MIESKIRRKKYVLNDISILKIKYNKILNFLLDSFILPPYYAASFLPVYDHPAFNNEVSFQEHVPVLNLNNLNFGITHYGGGYLYGELYSEVKPNIVFKSTDGEIQKEVYVQSKGNEIEN